MRAVGRLLKEGADAFAIARVPTAIGSSLSGHSCSSCTAEEVTVALSTTSDLVCLRAEDVILEVCHDLAVILYFVRSLMMLLTRPRSL